MSQRAGAKLLFAAFLLIQAGGEPTVRECLAAGAIGETSTAPLTLRARTRVETKPGSGQFNAVTQPLSWDPSRTAIVVCDMWNEHWCKGATRRVAEMAPRMNDVLVAARKRGVLIIHCPSDTMKFYEGTAERDRARRAPHVATKVLLKKGCGIDGKREGHLPIDDSDGGCDCEPHCKQGSPWTREIATLKIEPPDAITDSAEAVYLMKERGIENVILMGVHANMCVLGRPFAIRQLVQQGFHVLLMRDLTDTMYNSRSAPYVSHFTGTDLVVEHIEKHWCPSITSADFLGGREFRFSEDHRPRVVIVMAEPEYSTEKTLPKFAAEELGKEFRVSLVFGSQTDPADLPGLETITEADALLVSVRRRPLKPAQMKLLRDYVAAGKPVLGIRTASHAFSLRGAKPPAGLETWESWDADAFGGNYVGHHANGVKVTVTAADEGQHNPIFPIFKLWETGEPKTTVNSLVGHGSLYKVRPLAGTTWWLLLGHIPGQPEEPVAWMNHRVDNGYSFYTSLGHPDDFAEPAFRKLLVAALRVLTRPRS